MTRQKEKLLWVLFAGILVLLFLLSSTDLIIKEREKEIYSIALIIEDTRDENYVNFRKGVDRAAIEMHADVSFITLYTAGNSRQQLDLILREQQDGAQALIVSPVLQSEISAALVEGQIQKPVVLLNSDLTGTNIAAAISPDYYDMGEKLISEIMNEQFQDAPIYLLSGSSRGESTEEFRDGICAALEMRGCRYVDYRKGPDDSFLEKLEEAVGAGEEGIVLIALDPESLAEAAAILAEYRIHASFVAGLYGRGSTITILNYLDKEIITGICAVDNFSSGYLSVKMAVDAISSKFYHGPVRMESYYIKKEDLKNPEYEKKLYPIE